MPKKQLILENLKLQKLVHGGQCLSETPEGKKVFVWGGLPEELVTVRVTKKKSSYLEGVVEEVIKASPDRIQPKEPYTYLSSSPWQIMSYSAENSAKQSILEETFQRENVEDIQWEDFVISENDYGYRNKIELGFWGDDEGVHFASYIRGTHGKRIITHNALASDRINETLPILLDVVHDFCAKNTLRAGDLKTMIIRSSIEGEVVASLFVKQNDVKFQGVKLPNGVKGIVFYYSNPKSPASVPTEHLYTIGDITLTDYVLGKNITYDVNSFFQVNLPVFNKAMSVIKDKTLGAGVIDFYSGVGTIGIPLGASILVESDAENIKMAKINARDVNSEVVHATSETACEYITSESVLVVDPPRSGLHKDVIQRILEVKPPEVVYLSCNPSTQARDIAYLASDYKITYAQGFNFFPRTPHIESLILLEKK